VAAPKVAILISSSQKLIPRPARKKKLSIAGINPDSTGQNASQVKTGLIDQEVPNFKP
jgi:hypothetical protein